MFLSTTALIVSSHLRLLGGLTILSRLALGAQSNNLLLLWVSLEIRLLGFIICSTRGGLGGRYVFKYFIIQRVGSALLLFRALRASFSDKRVWLLLCAACLKLGAAPFHGWFVHLSAESPWLIFFILRFPQKILPTLTLTNRQGAIGSVFIYRALTFRVLGRLRVNQIKKLLAYSSVFGLAWVFAVLKDAMFWLLFLRTYTLGMALFVGPFLQDWLEDLSENNKSIRPFMGIARILGRLSIAGFPPSPGFFLKFQALALGVLSQVRVGVLSLMVVSSIFFLALYISAVLPHFTGYGRLRGHSENSMQIFLLVAIMILLVVVLVWFQVGVSHKKFWISRT